jgi:hypothetical protein
VRLHTYCIIPPQGGESSPRGSWGICAPALAEVLTTTDYFAVSDLSVIWDVFQIDEETCIGSWDVSNSLEYASAFVAKSSSPKRLETGIFHESRIFHFFSGDWVDDCVGLVLLLPIVFSEGNGHVG